MLVAHIAVMADDVLPLIFRMHHTAVGEHQDRCVYLYPVSESLHWFPFFCWLKQPQQRPYHDA